MARSLNALVLVLLAVATHLHGSVAQTRHVVGGSAGWTIPSGSAATYTNWAANQSFKLGDTLVFNFANGQHDVAKVNKSAFDTCNGGKPVFTITSSPASVTLNETGQQYFICTFNGHCSLGQKLAVNVGKASTTSPAPQPSGSGSPPKASPAPAPQAATTTPPPSPAPTPASSPAPAPSTGPVTYTVGGTMGWTVPSNGPAAYTNWTSGKTFKVGDILVFNFAKNAHNVEEVTKDKFDSCSSTSPIATYTNPPVRVTLNKSGEHYFICGIPGHCSAGQKLAVNVTGRGGATAPSPSFPAASPTGSATPSPSSSTTNPSSSSPNGAVSPPPQNSGAVSLRAVAFSATLFSVVAAAFFC